MAIEVRPLSEAMGAEIRGVDISKPIDHATFGQIHAAWLDHLILLFRDVDWTPEEHIAFTRRFGEPHIMDPMSTNLPGHPEIYVVSNVERDGKPLGIKRAGWGWHSDGEEKENPNKGSLIHALKIPPADGDTLFANMYLAWDRLPDETKAKIKDRRALRSRLRLHHVHYPHLPLTDEIKARRPDVLHPMARTHPETGRTSLFVGRWACEIEGYGEEEGKALLRELNDWAVRPEFVYRHQWRVGDAILWDNRCTQHCATPFDDERHERHMHRTTIKGTRPK